MSRFRYAPEIVERFPDINAAVVHLTRAQNGPTPPALQDAFGAAQRAALEKIGDTPLSEIPSLAAWRRAFTAFGVKPTQYRNAAEALLRRLTKSGSVPSINLLVDVANLVAVRYALPAAVFDQGPVTGFTTVRFASGEERFTDIATRERSDPEPGEVVFVDRAGLVSARRWCWRQSTESAAGMSISEALITVEALHDGAPDAVGAALEDLLALLSAYQPTAGLCASLLSADDPEFACTH
jgi:DNA/RNA-binding domain of Phe-tRNA-synthetase-like protein